MAEQEEIQEEIKVPENFPKPRLGETEILSSPIVSIGAGIPIVKPVVDRKDLTENQQNYQDQVSFIVQNMRQDHNQEPKKSVFTKANGDFDQREAWLSAVEIINRKKQGFKGNYFTEFNDKETAYKQFSLDFENVGRNYKFKVNPEDKSIDQEAISAWRTTRNPLVKGVEKGIGVLRGVVDLVDFIAIAAGESYTSVMNMLDPDEVRMFMQAEQRWKEIKEQGWHWEYKQVPGSIAVGKVKVPNTEEYLDEEFKTIYGDLSQAALDAGFELDPDDVELARAMIEGKPGGRLYKLSENIGKARPSHFSSEEGELMGHMTVGDVAREDFYAEMITAFGAEILGMRGAGLRLIAKEGGEKSLKENLKNGALNTKRLREYINAKDKAKLPSKLSTWLLEPVLAPLAYLDEAVGSKPLLDGWGGRITKARALEKMVNNPGMTRDAVLYSYLAFTMGEGIEQMMEQDYFTIGPTDKFSFQFVDTEFNTGYGAFGATMAWAMGTPILGRLIADYGLRSEFVYDSFSGILDLLGSGKKQGLSFEETSKSITGMLQYGLDYAQSGKYNLSGEFFAGLNYDQQTSIRTMLGQRHQRKVLLDMIISMNDVATNGVGNMPPNPAMFTAGLQALELNMEMSKLVGDRLRQIKNADGTLKYSEDNIKQMQAMTFGQALGMPVFEGLRIQLSDTDATLALAPYKRTGRNLIEAEGKEKIQSIENQKSFQDARIMEAILNDLEANNLLDEAGTSQVGDAMLMLKKEVSSIVANNVKKIELKNEIVDSIDVTQGDGPSLEATTQAVEELVVPAEGSGVVLDRASITYNMENDSGIIQAAKNLDPRLENNESITIQDRVALTWDTKNRNRAFLETVVNNVIKQKEGLYDDAFGNSYIGVTRYLGLEKGFKNQENIVVADVSDFRPNARHKMKRANVNKYDVDLKNDALDRYGDQLEIKIAELEASKNPPPIEGVEIVKPSAADIKKIDTNIKRLESIQSQILRARSSENLNGVLGNAIEGKFTIGNKEFTQNVPKLDFEMYRVEDINRLRSKSFQNYNNFNVNGADRAAYHLPFYNYILDNVPTGVRDMWGEAAQDANQFYRDIAAPLLKARSIKNFRLGEKYGQSFYNEADVLLSLVDDMDADSLLNLLDDIDSLEGIEIKIPKLDQKTGDVLMDGAEAITETYTGKPSELFRELVLGRLSERNLLMQNRKSFPSLEEKFNEFNVGELFTDADITNIKTGEDVRVLDTEVAVTDNAYENIVKKQYLDEEANNAWTLINNNKTASEIVQALNFNIDLSEQPVYSVSRLAADEGAQKTELYGNVPFQASSINTQLNALRQSSPEVADALQKVVLRGILDTYMGGGTGGLAMKTVNLADGTSLRVPEILEVFRHNGEVIETIIGQQASDDLALIMTMLSRDEIFAGTPVGAVEGRIAAAKEGDVAGTITGSKVIKADPQAIRQSQNDIDVYLKEFGGDESRRLAISGLHAEAGAQVIGSRFFNMARGMVSPGFVAFEFFLKSFSKKDVRALSNILSGGETSIGIFKDMFFDRNFSKKITSYSLKEFGQFKLTVLLAVTGSTDKKVTDIKENSLIDFSKIRNETTGEVGLTSEEDQIKFTQAFVDHIMGMSREDFSKSQEGVPSVYDYTPA